MIIIEGLDGVGKSTVTEKLISMGFSHLHYDYDKSTNDLMTKYISVIKNENISRLVADRSFFSELVYGKVLRGGSRINEQQFIELLKLYSEIDTKVIYLTSDKNILLDRRQDDKRDLEMLSNYYDRLNQEYEKIMNETARYLPVLHIDTSQKNIKETFKQCEDFVFGSHNEERIL